MVYDEENILLMTPGPVSFHHRVYQAMSKVEFHHRTPEHRKTFGECVSMMKKVMQTENDVFIFTGSGTSAMDAAIANCVSPKDKVLNLIGGKFGERWAEITETFGAKSIRLEVEWGKAIKPEMVSNAIDKEPDIKFVTMCHNETSTAVLNPAQEIAKITNERDKLLIVDGVTSVGGDYVYPDKWGIDILVTGSQKCLGCPPGLGMIMVGPKAWEEIGKREKIPSYYVKLPSYRKAFEKSLDTPYTPAIPLVYGLHESLTMILEEGYENRVKRHRLMAETVRSGMKALGLQLLAEKGYESNTMTALKYPDGVDDNAFRKGMQKHGILVAGAQAHLKGKIFRVAHMNIIAEREVLLVLAMTGLVLRECGFKCESGAGVSAAQEIFLKNLR
ncbi:MAG: alanine--glyoxylate aminotransferase family protein [Candidatus Bathyarchaeota archaeon]|nr:MAG: alanine--glyoxylate aminotransferase family protein [Candidatus Bathyarchaeota archaeon]